MKRRFIVLPTTIVAALLLAGTISLALAQPGPPDEPPGQAVAAEHRPDEAGPQGDHEPGPPEEPPGHSGEARGQKVSEAAHEKVEVTNPAGKVISPSLVGFCRSQAPWMSDKGDSCDDLAELFNQKPDGDGQNGDDDSGDATSVETTGAQHDRGRHLGQLRAFEAANASLEIARGLFAHVLSLLA